MGKNRTENNRYTVIITLHVKKVQEELTEKNCVFVDFPLHLNIFS